MEYKAMAETTFDTVFTELKSILSSFSETLNCVTDEYNHYYLNTFHIMPNKQPLYFGSVQIKKNYVSFHVMPVYVFPALLKGISPELKKRMQGKSCFNFKKNDPILFSELTALVAAGFKAYQESGYIK